MREKMTGSLILRMFRAGLDTRQIADRLDWPEHKVEKLLIQAREEDRDFDNIAKIPAVSEPPIQSGEG